MKTVLIFNNAILATALLLTSSSLGITGCGQIPGENSISATTASNSKLNNTASTTSSLTTNTIGRYTCPAQDVKNVVPNASEGLNVFAFYQVCVDSSSVTDILVQGNAGNRDQICVFPADSTYAGSDDQYTYYQHDPSSSTGLPWYVCTEPNTNGTTFTFAGITYNAVYIVDAVAAQQMQTCLIEQNSEICPPYSYGSFR